MAIVQFEAARKTRPVILLLSHPSFAPFYRGRLRPSPGQAGAVKLAPLLKLLASVAEPVASVL
jgi:hypothetical protein